MIKVPTDFPTIQTAIDSAANGDTIKVRIYTEQITISKRLKLIGSGTESTIIKAPTKLNNNLVERPYIIDINNSSQVSMKNFTISGAKGVNCPDLTGVSVMENANLILDSAVVRNCTTNGVHVGAPPAFSK